jgi:hypothetical protein
MRGILYIAEHTVTGTAGDKCTALHQQNAARDQQRHELVLCCTVQPNSYKQVQPGCGCGTQHAHHERRYPRRAGAAGGDDVVRHGRGARLQQQQAADAAAARGGRVHERRPPRRRPVRVLPAAQGAGRGLARLRRPVQRVPQPGGPGRAPRRWGQRHEDQRRRQQRERVRRRQPRRRDPPQEGHARRRGDECCRAQRAPRQEPVHGRQPRREVQLRRRRDLERRRAGAQYPRRQVHPGRDEEDRGRRQAHRDGARRPQARQEVILSLSLQMNSHYFATAKCRSSSQIPVF